MGLKRRPAEPAEGRSAQVWADSARNTGVCASAGSRLQGWNVFDRFRGAGLDLGLKVDAYVGHGLPIQRWPACQG